MDEKMIIDYGEILKECEEKMKDVSKHWGLIGVLLKMDEPVLGMIKNSNSDDAIACKIMLSSWLASDPENPLTDLNNALEKLKDIRSTDKVVVTARVDRDIDTQITTFKRWFREIVMKTYEWLKNCLPIEQAILWVNLTIVGPSGTALAIEGNIENYATLRQELPKQWRYTRPDILAQLIREEATDADLKQSMESYMTNFQEFRRKFKLERTTIFDDPDETKPCLVIIFKSGTSLDNIEVFLEDVFGRCKCHLYYQKIEVSSVKVSLQFSASMMPLIQKCIDFYNEQEPVEQNKVKMCIEPPKKKTLPDELHFKHPPSSHKSKNKVLKSSPILSKHLHPTCSVQSCM